MQDLSAEADSTSLHTVKTFSEFKGTLRSITVFIKATVASYPELTNYISQTYMLILSSKSTPRSC
jgi:hypothetical protein